MPHKRGTVSKSRLDALGDAMFGVAMTLLVIDIRLPDDFSPGSAQELLDAVIGLRTKFTIYIVTFFVVGLRWLGSTHVAEDVERVSGRFAMWTLLHLFLITCLPFSTMMVSRYETFPLAVWIYAGNMALGALVSMYLSRIAEADGAPPHGEGKIALWLLVASAAASVAISFFSPAHSMNAYLINFLRPWISGWRQRGRETAS